MNVNPKYFQPPVTEAEVWLSTYQASYAQMQNLYLCSDKASEACKEADRAVAEFRNLYL